MNVEIKFPLTAGRTFIARNGAKVILEDNTGSSGMPFRLRRADSRELVRGDGQTVSARGKVYSHGTDHNYDLLQEVVTHQTPTDRMQMLVNGEWVDVAAEDIRYKPPRRKVKIGEVEVFVGEDKAPAVDAIYYFVGSTKVDSSTWDAQPSKLAKDRLALGRLYYNEAEAQAVFDAINTLFKPAE